MGLKWRGRKGSWERRRIKKRESKGSVGNSRKEVEASRKSRTRAVLGYDTIDVLCLYRVDDVVADAGYEMAVLVDCHALYILVYQRRAAELDVTLL